MQRPNLSNLDPEVSGYITSLEQEVSDIRQMFENLQRLYFGKKSEKIRIPAQENGPVQLSMFDEEDPVPQPVAEKVEETEVSAHKRKKKRTKEEIIANLPQIIHECKLDPEKRCCPRCGNDDLECIGKELVYTEYVRVPAHVDCHEYYVEKYACRACENDTSACEACAHADPKTCSVCPDRPGTVVISAVLPEEVGKPLIKGSKASPSVVAQICYDKFEMALPEYRQEKEWERLGFPLSRQTMNNWLLRIDEDHLRGVVAYMLRSLKENASVIYCDETPVEVLNEKTDSGRPKKCHMWVTRSGKTETRQIVVFTYRASRAGDVATDILEGYKQYFVSDGYSGYNELGKEAIRCGCWAHLRRKFYDAVPGHDMDLPGAAREGVRYCDKLFRIEEKLMSVAPEERLRTRQVESRPVVDEFYNWIGTVQPGNKNLKDAVTYARNQKEALLRFLEDGRIPLSNNVAENAIRPFVVGRKNWLFCKSNDGATTAADLYSLIETAKANDLDVLKYLNYFLRRLTISSSDTTGEFFESLMPWNDAVRNECQRGCI